MTRREKLVAIVETFGDIGALRDDIVRFKTDGGSGLVNYVNSAYDRLVANASTTDDCAPQNEALVQAQAALEQAQAAIAGALSK